MIELKGKYNEAKIFTDIVDEASISQVMLLLNQEFVAGSRIRLMPDIHAGSGCTIGTTMTISDKIVPNLVGVDIGCVDKETEFLSRNGWKKICEFDNDEILIYDLEKNVSLFNRPLAYIKLKNDKFYRLKTKYGINQMLTGEHKCLLRKGTQNKQVSIDKAYVVTAKEVYERHNSLKLGLRDNFVCEIPHIQNVGLNFTDEELRIIVMFQADGNEKHESNMLWVRFKKDRKIKRCIDLLNKAEIPYTITNYKDGVCGIRFNFDYDIKDFRCLYGLSKHQLGVVCDEIMHWDGNISAMQYSSKYKYNVDFVQYAFACNGYRTNIDLDHRQNGYYRLSVSKSKPRIQLAGTPKTPIDIVKSKDGYKYCFTTTTGYWIMRRGNCICITGNCGMEVTCLAEKHIELQKLDKLIYKKIPSGFNIRTNTHRYFDKCHIEELYCKDKVNLDRAEKSLGTLGGGNHFIECNKDDDGKIYIVVHSGSRHLGLEVANYYQDLAYAQLNGNSSEDQQKLITELKAQSKEKEIQKALNELKNVKRTNIPKQLAYACGELFEQYIHDMKIVQEFAAFNRQAMMDEIVKGMGIHVVNQFTTIHNYIDIDNMILRKGAVSAKNGERLIIPINMRDGSLICIGKGNGDWNQSAPHGAGRLMSRSKAKESFTVSEFKKQMEDVYTTSVNKDTLDECPMAYKGIDDILNNIGDTVEVERVIKPIYNFKAGGD